MKVTVCPDCSYCGTSTCCPSGTATFTRMSFTGRGACKVSHTSTLQPGQGVSTVCVPPRVALAEFGTWANDQGRGGQPGEWTRPCSMPPTGYQLSASAQMILSPRFRACAKMKSIPRRISSFHTPGEDWIAWPLVMVCAHMRTTFVTGSGPP